MHTFLARILLLVAGVLIGIGGVAGVIFLVQDDTTTSPGEQTQTTPVVESLPLRNTASNADTSESGGKPAVPSTVDQLVFPERTFERKATIVSWVATLNDDEVLSSLEQSIELSWHVSPANRTELQTILLEKLSTTAPDRAADFALARDDQQQRYSMAKIVLQAWANTDIDGAIARVKELDEQASRSFVETILTARDDFSLEQMREIAIELGNESSAFAYYFRNLSKGKIEHPKETWYEIINIANRESVQNTTGFALSGIAVAWVEEQGLTVLDEILSSISNDSEYSNVLSQIFGTLSADQPEEIFDFVMSNLGDQAQEIIQRSRIVYYWARKDPMAMLAKAETLPATSFRQSLLQRAVGQWAQNNPHQILEQLELVPPGQRNYASSSAIQTLTRTSPTEAAKFVLQVADDALQAQLAQSLIRQWANIDANAAKEWVLGLPTNEPMRASLIYPLASSLVYTDPRGAFELALQQPIEEHEPGGFLSTGHEVSILSMISHQDIQLALELLPQVRESGRTFAFTTVGSNLIQQGNAQQALRLANQLSEEPQQQYYRGIAMSWSMNDPKGLLEAFDDFPASTKSKVALTITISNESSSTYSDEEIASMEKHLSKEDKELLNQLQDIDMSNPSPEDVEKLQQLYSW